MGFVKSLKRKLIGEIYRRPRLLNKADRMREEQISAYKQSFTIIDSDGDDKITIEELASAMHSMGLNPSEDQLQHMFEKVDVDGNGVIDLSEFLSLMLCYNRQQDAHDEIRELFRALDRDGDGFISPAEVRYVMTKLGEQVSDADVTAMITEADVNGDGQIDYKEFAELMKNQHTDVWPECDGTGFLCH